MQAIRNPIEVGIDALKAAGADMMSVAEAMHGEAVHNRTGVPVVKRIGVGDVRSALKAGLDDFAACRTDVVFICLIYPIVGILIARTALHYSMLPLLFPAASGFALLAPLAAIGLYELSRQRERGQEVKWSSAFGLIASPRFGAMLIFGLGLIAVFMTWLAVAHMLYSATLGPAPPASILGFAEDVLTTGAGWAMVVLGMGIGFVFALTVFAVSVVSFPLMLDRNVGLGTAVTTSIRVVSRNPKPMAVWAAILAAGLAIGTIPFFLGLIVILPILGHATWHIYRKTVE
ncbi:DUF2189 domain-containing protein [Pacificispira sp.]|uniref:DUF2189 domain-containing protein n=1 Tax=Pacificispira sp. TaxID=2888761 RepID=UPI003B52BC87